MGQKQDKAKKAERAEGLTAWLNKMKPKASVMRGKKKVTLYHVERRPRKGCKKPSAYRGVGWDTASRKWKARIEPLGSSTFAYLGRFSSEIDAAVAYSRAVDRYGLPMSGGRGCVAVKAAAALGSKEQAQEALAAVAHEHARGIQQGDAPGTPHASPSAGAKSAARLLRCVEEDAAAQLAAARGGALGCGGEVTHGGGDAAAAALLEQSAAPLVLPLPPLASPPPSRPRADASTLILQDWQQKQDNVFVGRVWGFPGALPGELVQLVARVDGARAPEAGMLLYSGLQKQPVMLGLPR